MSVIKKNKRGEKTDVILAEAIEKYPCLSQYELARKLKWSPGRVNGSIRRLLRSREFILRVVERDGRRVELAYPVDEKPSNLIEIPSELLKAGNPVWNDQAFFYALDSSTIGVSGHEIPEWKALSCFIKAVPLRKEKGKFALAIPAEF